MAGMRLCLAFWMVFQVRRVKPRLHRCCLRDAAFFLLLFKKKTKKKQIQPGKKTLGILKCLFQVCPGQCEETYTVNWESKMQKNDELKMTAVIPAFCLIKRRCCLRDATFFILLLLYFYYYLKKKKKKKPLIHPGKKTLGILKCLFQVCPGQCEETYTVNWESKMQKNGVEDDGSHPSVLFDQKTRENTTNGDGDIRGASADDYSGVSFVWSDIKTGKTDGGKLLMSDFT